MANDFSGDSNCKALWRFESGALTTDDIGSNTLSNYANRVSVDTDSGDYHEGSASAYFDSSISPWMHIADADLDSGFPLKSSASNADFGLCLWFKLADTSANYMLLAKDIYLESNDESLLVYTRDYGTYYGVRVIKGYNSGNSSEVWEAISSLDLQAGRWYHLGLTWDDSSKEFNIVLWDDTGETKYTDSDTQTYSMSLTTSPLNLGCRANSSGVPNVELNGWLDEVVVFDDILSESEIDSIRQGAYGTGGTDHELSGSIDAVSSVTCVLKTVTTLAGTCSAQSHLTAALSLTVALAGSTGALSSVAASLQVLPSGRLKTRLNWQQEALFNGMTANAFKLGTVLTGGWFWMRRAGCSAVYRGPAITQIDSRSIVCVANSDAREIALPGALLHEPNSEYCYLVQRFNNCGYQEQTTTAAVRVRIGPDGRLAEPAPNGVYGLHGQSVAGDKVRLGWFYCPLDQETTPEVFSVYGDDGASQVDLGSALAVIPYEGRRFYSYLSESLPEGRHVFVVRAASVAGVQSASLPYLHLPVEVSCPQSVTILSAEAIA